MVLNLSLMKKAKTPKPGSKEYDVEKTEDLTKPEFHSSTDKKASHEDQRLSFPAAQENLISCTLT